MVCHFKCKSKDGAKMCPLTLKKMVLFATLLQKGTFCSHSD